MTSAASAVILIYQHSSRALREIRGRDNELAWECNVGTVTCQIGITNLTNVDTNGTNGASGDADPQIAQITQIDCAVNLCSLNTRRA